MKIILQKVKKASVSVNNKVVGSIDKGYCLLVGVHKESTEEDAKYLAKKVAQARLFEDENDKINLSLKDVGGSILSVSEFTLYADTKKGNRPSYVNALGGDKALPLYEEFNKELSKYVKVEAGVFGGDMEISFTNIGPITISLEKENL